MNLHSNRYNYKKECFKDLINGKKPIEKYISTGYRRCNKAILFTNARDEKNTKEWAAHHLLLGFHSIVIFDHKSEPPLGPQFLTFDKRVKIIRVDICNPVKIPLMKMAVKIASANNFDWMYYLDADEFLVLNAFTNVQSMLNCFHYADSLSINWLMFGTNYHNNEPNGLIIENYTRCEEKLNPHVKTFVRPSKVVNIINPHYYEINNPLRSFTILNKKMPKNCPFNPCLLDYNKMPAYIAHYIYQSEETYLKRKINRDADDGTGKRGRNVNIHEEYNNVENLIIKDKYSDKINNFLMSIL